MTTAQDRGWGPGWPNCQTDKLVLIEPVPGKRFTVRHELAELFAAFLARYDAEVEDINIGVDDGCYSCRPIRGTEDNEHPVPSNHSWAMALDLNTARHPLGARGTFSADELAALRRLQATPAFRRIAWGGDYQHRADEMHHEYMGTPADAAADTALLHQPKPAPPAEEDDDMIGILIRKAGGTGVHLWPGGRGTASIIAGGRTEIDALVKRRAVPTGEVLEVDERTFAQATER